MINNKLSGVFALIAFVFFTQNAFSQNLLINGDFESGGNGVGFSLNGAGYTQINAPFSGTTSPGNYAFTTNPQPMNTSVFISGGDHTTGTGNMMVIDGNSTGGAQRFWRAGNTGGGVCSLTIGATYTFSYWIKSVSTTVTNAATQADIGIQFNNANNITLVAGSTLAPLPASGWQQVIYTFTPTNACVNIELWNNNTNMVGNDFAVDDFVLTPPPTALSITSSFTNPRCRNSNDGVIVGYGIGGITPYFSFNLTGPVNQSNITGVFTGLPPGNYTIQVIDAMGSDAQMFVTLTNPSGINAGTDATICSGNSTTLSATGSATGYTWTASPADASLTTPNISNPIVSPTQTTTYTATSTTNNTINLISNGNFSNGNVSFDTDYTFFSASNPSGSQRAYGITLNPNTWETGFAACGDHTSGSGLMMVVDGSIYNAGNDLVWAQTVGVGASQNYTLSFWVQTLSVNNPATLRVVINGVTVGTINAPATTCTWLNFSQVWNSGANTIAAIQIFDANVNSNGNDFALDDIAFTTNSTCTLTDQVVVTVNSALTPVISCGTPTSSSVTFNWAAVTGATNYTVSYSINGGTSVNAGTTNSTNYTVSSLLSTDNVTITVTPNGTGCFASTVDTCGALSSCPTPVASVTQQPTCAVPTGTIVFTSPLNTSPLPVPSDLFISEVTDESTGSLSYIEIFNGTGSPKNLSNYKLKVYNNGGSTPSTNCDIPLSGTLANNDVFVVGLGSATNQGGVIPDLVVAACGAFNTDDNVRLTTSSDVEIDLWGRTDGVSFTPLNQAGYTYRRNQTAPHPSLVWNPADWTALDPQDYTNVGTYSLQLANYQYSVNNGANYQSSPTFTGLAPNTYNLVIKDLVSGCVSSPPLVLVVNPTPTVTPPSVTNVTYCQNSTASPLTATPSTGGTLNWYGTNATGGTASATAPTPSTSSLGTTTYYVSQTVGGCESTRAAIVVTITNQAPTATPNLFCDDANATPTSASFDFNNVGQTSFTYTYSIDGGTPVTGSLVSPSHFDVSGVTQGQAVTFTLTWNGVCTASQTVTCYPQCVTPVTPTFSPVATICEGQTLSPLPTTSLNGVNGSWSPALNNLATTNYLFTPSNAGECATNTNLTITVIPDPTLVINNPTAVCSPNVVNLTAAAVTNGTNVGTLTYWTNATATTPLSNPNAVSVSGTYYIKNTNGICTDIKPVVVTINPSPSLSITNPSAVCSPNTVDITQSSITSGSSGGGTLTYWTNASATTPLVNPNSISASGTYYIKSTVGSCFDIKPVVVTINPTPNLSITNPLAVCSPNTVDITQSSITSGSSGGGTLTYWTNASATTPLVNPNSISASGTYYIKSTVGSCFDIKPVVVTINPTPSLIIVNPSPVCSPSTVNITLPAITSGSTAGGTLTYWTNASATTSLINPSTISVSGTYYIKLTVGSCFDIKPVTVVINPTINPTFNIPNIYCEGASIPALPLVSNNGISGTWSPALNNLSTANYLFTPNAGQCANSFNQLITVVPNVTPTLNIVETCNSNSVTVTNPLGSDYEYSLDGQPYQASPFFNNLPVGNHTIVSHHIVANCISNPENFVINSVSNDVVVNQNPSPLEICDPNNDGFEIFDLTTAINDITNNIPYNVTFHETLTDATVDGTVIPNASAYFNINPWLQTIYVRVESLTTSCFEIVSLTLQVHPTPEAVEPADLH
ncbi:MAG TPA: lamin tail domain-containing protein, partial [Flavobacterium lutivivi]|nr:lamin tail domain-containing protein [Flavobacterium lutivivi]